MNPIVTIWLAVASVAGFGLMMTQDPEVDTWGLVSASTAYSPVEAGTLPDALGSPQTPQTTLPPYQGAGCAEWADVALRGGFTVDQLPVALQVAEFESMCLPDAIGDNGQSFGLWQINDYWCTPVKYWPQGYLQTMGIVSDCTDLLNPLINAHAAWHISTQYGWQNWTTYDRLP
jgi:hypothetical protein